MVLLYIFIIGSITGYLMELFYTRLMSKKWKNVGFLKGPYLPQYGFGVVIIYFVCSLNIGLFSRFFIFFILLPLLEYLTGYIFIKKLGYQFWDYSNRKYNINGLVCPLFSFIWATIGSVFYYTLYPLFQYPINNFVVWAALLILGIIMADFINTLYRLKIEKINRTKRAQLNEN